MSFPRACIEAMTAFQAPPPSLQSPPVRALHLNESPFPPPASAIKAMREAAAQVNRYPEHYGARFVALLSKRNVVPPTRIVTSAGSSELLGASCELALEAGDEAIVPTPGFPGHAKNVAVQGGCVVAVANAHNGAVDVGAVLAAVTPRTRLAFVTSPHNPTGSLLAVADIERLADELPEHVFLHFDEAYHEFGRHAGGPDVIRILERRRRAPWLVSRSMSKAYGLAGARIGYGLASSEAVAEAYGKIRATFSVNAIALAGAAAALQDTAYVEGLLDHTANERRHLARELARLGFEEIPSRANFASLVAPADCAPLVRALAAQGILTQAFTMSDGRSALRISVGTREDSDALVQALAAILSLDGQPR